MKVVIDIECNSLVNPINIWVIVCKDIETGTLHIFRKVTSDDEEKRRFISFASMVNTWIGHNILGYDQPILSRLIGSDVVPDVLCTDTLILSKLIDYPRQGHSIEDYGLEFNYPKIKFNKFTEYSQEMEDYCVRDVEICHKIFTKYSKYCLVPDHRRSIDMEHRFQRIVNILGSNGFAFNTHSAERLLLKVEEELAVLDKDILEAFPPRLKFIREVIPKETKYGTISLTSIPKTLRSDISDMLPGAAFSYCSWTAFNPSSHKQIVQVLDEAGWRPVDKTVTHIETERELNRLKHTKRTPELDIVLKELYSKMELMKKAGWKINEANLETLPQTAPLSARTLARRILLESRRRTLTEWLGLIEPDSRIHGKFYSIGAWTHRMAHQNPNTANIPNEFDTQGKKKLYGKELRALWCAPKNRLLVGVDAESIQLRIFAHYINDPVFTEALVKGKKDDKTDPHSLNQSILGPVCRSRAAAKRYIYALLLGAGAGKLREILDCSEQAAAEAYQRLLGRYKGYAELKETIIPRDAKRGWFNGLDGRRVRIPGETEGSRKHLAMSGYLQNGEAVIMKSATLLWHDKLKDYDAKLVNFVHDEWQVECPNNMSIALDIANMMASSLKSTGEDLQLRCPLAGSIWNEDLKDYTIATNWSKTH